MGTVLAARGVIPQELPQEKKIANQAQARASKLALAKVAVKKFESTLPGHSGNQDIGPVMANLERLSLAVNRRLKFEVDHESHEVTVKIIDGETDKVIKVLPPEELRRLHDNIRDTIEVSIEETIGFLFDERV
jgi:flagellar protein FlaG